MVVFGSLSAVGGLPASRSCEIGGQRVGWVWIVRLGHVSVDGRTNVCERVNMSWISPRCDGWSASRQAGRRCSKQVVLRGSWIAPATQLPAIRIYWTTTTKRCQFMQLLNAQHPADRILEAGLPTTALRHRLTRSSADTRRHTYHTDTRTAMRKSPTRYTRRRDTDGGKGPKRNRRKKHVSGLTSVPRCLLASAAC